MYAHMWGMWGAGHPWFWPGGPFLLLFGILLIVLGLWLVSGGVPPWDRFQANRAIEILDERYAAGELSTAEYQERLTHLRRR